jgi:hypothetical protein
MVQGERSWGAADRRAHLGCPPQLGVGMGGTREKQGVTEGGDVPPLPLLTQTTPISPIWKS